ncbi:MAG TPA: glycosyltransferase family 4 protein [Chloroflexi bacterium]|nr:glycosyltransferase family 4 protein [Chloroflexota bacterium]
MTDPRCAPVLSLPLRIALVHDWLNQMGGAENVLEELVQLFPGAPVFTSIYDPRVMPPTYQAWDIRTTFMQRLPGVTHHHQKYLPVYPLAFARTDLSDYDLVLSNKSGFCHGVRTDNGKRKATHVCYCLTPTRFLWLFDQYREREQITPAIGALLQPMLAQLRRWDYAAAQRVDHFIAISREVQRRIRDIYHRESVVIHPPVDTDYFRPAQQPAIGDYYLVVGRLIPYKRIDLAVQAFAHLPHEKLIVVGDGRDREALMAQATPNVSFTGRLPRAQVKELLQSCKAFLFPGLEDFGIAPVEALSAGRPVIAFAGGGALDTVTPGETGELFQKQTVTSLLSVLQHFDPHAYRADACRAQAERFSAAAFRTKLMAHLHTLLG